MMLSNPLITWNFSLRISGGGAREMNGSINSDTYQVSTFKVPSDDAEKSFNFQQGESPLEFICLTIKDNKYSDKVKCVITDIPANPDPANPDIPIQLTNPHLLIGGSLISLLKRKPNILKITNSSGQEVTLEILAGRNVSQ